MYQGLAAHLPVNHDEAESWPPTSALTSIHPHISEIVNSAGKGGEDRTIIKHEIAGHVIDTRNASFIFFCPPSSWHCIQGVLDSARRSPRKWKEGDLVKSLQKSKTTPTQGATGGQGLGGCGGERKRIKPLTFPLPQQLLQKVPLGSTFWGLDQIPESAQSIWKHLCSTGFAYRRRRHLLSRTE